MGLKHQAASTRKWRAAIRQVETHFPHHLPPILFLTDPDRVPNPIGAIRALPKGSAVIYRHFGETDRQSQGAAMKAVCADSNLRFLISADPGLALALKADGVHWPEAKLPSSRHWRGRFALQTASAHSIRAIKRAEQARMDGVLFSAIFASNSPNAGKPIGPTRLRNARKQTTTPVYALGGITPLNACRVADTCGLAAIDGLVSS
ncbi:MAG: thiamine phosphate synthase [Pseudomonadota bacterium]